MGFFKQLGKDLTGGLDLLSTIYSRPVQTISALATGKSKEVVRLVKETRDEKPLDTIKKTAVNTALVAGTIYLGGASLIPKTIGGKLLAIGGVSAVLTSPKVAKFLEPTEIIDKAVTGGEILADVVEGDSDIDLGDALATGGLVGAGAVIGGLVVDYLKDIDLGNDKNLLPDVKPSAVGVNSTPILPERTTVSPKRTYKRRRAKKPTSIRQSVRVNIISNKNYLKHRCY